MIIQELIQILRQMVGLHLKLSECAKLKKRLIIENKVEDLTKLMGQEARLMRLVEEEDARRQEAITRFLYEQGVRLQGRISVSELAKLVRERDLKLELLTAAAQLTKCVKRLKEQNALNQMLIQQSLQFIAFNMDLILGEPESAVTYRKPATSAYELQRKAVLERRA